MRVKDLKVGDTMRTLRGELRLLVRTEELAHFTVRMTWLLLESGELKQLTYSLDEPISSGCEVIRRGRSLILT